MRTDSQLRSEFRSALEAVTPPAPWLVHAVKKGLGTKAPSRRSYRAPFQLRFGLNVIAILVLIGVALAAVGVYVTTHQPVAPAAHPGIGRVFDPTKMVTASTGWSWVDPELWRTTDGGANWTDVSPPPMPTRMSQSTGTFYLLDATHAWVAQSSQGATGGLFITTFRTTDGGKTWHGGASIGGVSPKLFFIDENHGWLLMPPEGSSPADSLATLYSTDDAGRHWNFTSSAPWTGWNSGAMTFSSLTTGWILGTEGSLQVTHDGGVTWHVQALPITLNAGVNIGEPRFFDPQHGLITAFITTWAGLASPVELLVTSDGGSSWSVRSLPGPTGWLDFADANHGWAIAGPANLFEPPAAAVALPLYRTDDGGLTWVPVLTNILLRSPEGVIGPFHFVDRNNGFMVRWAKQSSDFSLWLTQWLKTTDGGRTWTVVVETLRKP
jgi:photosystem II stability/assembly factor-like uncharacterized protein